MFPDISQSTPYHKELLYDVTGLQLNSAEGFSPRPVFSSSSTWGFHNWAVFDPHNADRSSTANQIDGKLERYR